MSSVITITDDHHISLKEIDPSRTNGISREEAEAQTALLGAELTELSELLYEANTQGLLIVLQGMDTSGKDGTIRCLLNFANAQSTRVMPFKVPTPIESSHDFLWRIHNCTPGRSEIAIFNRSHYEDVLVVRVHQLADIPTIEKRYRYINAFEQLLADSGVIICKFFLHISKQEQQERLIDREKDADKSWKLSVADWKERDYWDDYQHAYELALEQCGHTYAPWHIVPANHKWYRNYLVMQTLVQTLRPHAELWKKQLQQRGQVALAELKTFRASNKT